MQAKRKIENALPYSGLADHLRTVLKARLDSKGKVTKVELVSSSGSESYDKSIPTILFRSR